jgi:hypothetical protein
VPRFVVEDRALEELGCAFRVGHERGREFDRYPMGHLSAEEVGEDNRVLYASWRCNAVTVLYVLYLPVQFPLISNTYHVDI